MRTLVKLVSPGGRAAGHQILIFHRVLAAPDPLFPDEMTAARFETLLACLVGHFDLLPLSEAVELLNRNQLPPASLSITFDDGYADNRTIAAPLLQSMGIPATVFVAAGFLDGGRMWNDTVIETARTMPAGDYDLSGYGVGTVSVDGAASRRALIDVLIPRLKHLPPAERQARVDQFSRHAGQLPDDLMMTSQQVRQLAGMGIEVGAHTLTHPILLATDDTHARAEIADSRAQLEAMTGTIVDLFAYPNGKHGRDFDDRHVDMVRELGFRAAVSTDWGVSRATSNRWRLPRFTPWHRQPTRFVFDLLRNRHGLLRR